jgi:hypothetical protein
VVSLSAPAHIARLTHRPYAYGRDRLSDGRRAGRDRGRLGVAGSPRSLKHQWRRDRVRVERPAQMAGTGPWSPKPSQAARWRSDGCDRARHHRPCSSTDGNMAPRGEPEAGVPTRAARDPRLRHPLRRTPSTRSSRASPPRPVGLSLTSHKPRQRARRAPAEPRDELRVALPASARRGTEQLYVKGLRRGLTLWIVGIHNAVGAPLRRATRSAVRYPGVLPLRLSTLPITVHALVSLVCQAKK